MAARRYNGSHDFEAIRRLLDDYGRQLFADCLTCAVTKHCTICFSHVEQQRRFRRNPTLCEAINRDVPERLSQYISILELNPGADFSIETDIATIEKRMLFAF